MAKKNMDILLGNILGKAAIHPQDRFDKSPGDPQEQQPPSPNPQTESDSPNDEPWRHFSFICSKELVDKVQSIARKEGFTIRSFMEYVMKQGVEAYESKYGKVKKIRTKTIREVMWKMWMCSHVHMNTLIHVHVDTYIHIDVDTCPHVDMNTMKLNNIKNEKS